MLSAAGAIASASSASYVNATYISDSPGVGVNLSIDGGATYLGTQAGALNFVKNSGGPDLPDNFSTFCCDIPKHVGGGTAYDWERADLKDVPTPPGAPFNPMGAAKADQISELYGRFRNSISSNDEYGGFAIAIWAIIYGNASLTNVSGDRFDSGLFSVTGAYQASVQAETYLSAIDGTGPRMGGLYAIAGVTADGPQDQIVPTPGSLALLGLGTMLAGRRRR
jgi:MYXO-CTERM domain-containing protein